MNNKPKKYSTRLDFRCTPELKHTFIAAQAINKDKFSEFLLKACNKFISKYSTNDDVVHDELNDGVVHDELNDGVVHDETDKSMTYDVMNDDVRRDELNDGVVHDDDVVRDDGVVHDELNDDVRRDELNLSDSEINDLLIYSEVDPDYKSKVKTFKRLRIKNQSNSLYDEVFGQPTAEAGMEALFND